MRTTGGNAILVRVDGNHGMGLGHLYRSRSVARALRQNLGLEPIFLVLGTTLDSGFERILADEGFRVEVVSGAAPNREYPERIRRLIATEQPIAVLTDLLTPDTSDLDLLADPELRDRSIQGYVEMLKTLGPPVISITDEPERIAIRPDIVIDHSCHSPLEDYEKIVGTEFYLGTEYFPLSDDFVPFVGRPKATPDKVRRVLVLFGGSDHNRFTLRAVREVAKLPEVTFTVVLGPAIAEREAARAEIISLGGELVEGAESIAMVMNETHIAVTAGGNTVFELAALGIPAIALCTRERQCRNADYFQSRGCLVNLGLGTEVTDETIGGAVRRLAEDAARRARMTIAGRCTVDGRGLERIADIVLKCTAMREVASA